MTKRAWLTMSGWSEQRGRLRGLALITLTVLVFALLLRRINPAAALQAVRTIPPGVWALATLLTLSFPFFSALRWRLTLRAIGHQVSFWRCLTIILGTSPISAIAPSKAGDLLKAVSLRREISVLEVGGTVLTERVFDVLILASLSLAGGMIVGNAPIVRFAAVLVGAGVVGLLTLPLLVAAVPKPALREKLERVIRILGALRARPLLAFGVLALTTANWLASIAQTHLLLVAVGASTPFVLTVSALPIAIFVGLVPVTIGGMGTRDAALITLLAPTASAPQALSVGLLYSLFGYWLPALLGIPFLRSAFPGPASGQQDTSGWKPGPASGQRDTSGWKPGPASGQRDTSGWKPGPASGQRDTSGWKAPREGPERLCKICAQPVFQRHTAKGIAYYHCAACDFLQNFYLEDRPPTAREQVATHDEARARLWQPGDREHERQKAWEILTLMTSPLAWQSRKIHAALARTPWYRRWYQDEARRKMRRLLDFGCGHGTTVQELRDCGFDCEGLDPFAPAGTQNVRRAFLEEARLPAESFDGVFAIETMEHIPNVLATFQGIARLLRPGGVFLAQTRRLEDAGYRADRERWFYLQEPTTHVAIYSATAMRRIAALTGFCSVRFRGAKLARFVK